MCGALVAPRRLGRAIGLNQKETGGIVYLLHDVESRNPWLENARPRILDGRQPEGIDVLRLNLNIYMNNQHRVSIYFASSRYARARFGASIAGSRAAAIRLATMPRFLNRQKAGIIFHRFAVQG